MDSVFEEIYQKYHLEVFQFLFYLVRNKEQAEDLVQEVYIRVLKSYNQFEGRSSEKTWLFSIARNVAIDFFRKQKGWKTKLLEKFDLKSNLIKDEEPLPDEIAIQKEEIKWVYKSLSQCSVDQRTVIIMRFLQDFSIAETAQILGWSESKVKTTQHRSLKILKQEMKKLREKEGFDNERIRVER